MIRIWGLLRPQCLPVFSRSADTLDILATLFRLLTKLALNPNDPDEMLLDECCLLQSQVLIPQLNLVHSRPSVASPLLSHFTLPMHFDFNVESDEIKFWPDLPFNETGLSDENIVDSVRYLQLGKQPQSLRICTRCGACSTTSSIAKTAAMKSWEQRWAKSCRCGGSWRFDETV
jgi:mediator of RNA polymerase II transcription subunit 16